MFGATVQEQRRQHAKALDGTLPTPEQLQKLGRMSADAFLDIRNYSRNQGLVFALADAFHNLPAVVYSSQFKWSWLLVFLEVLERDYPEVGRKFIADFDEITGLQSASHTVPAPARGQASGDS
jgi:hypothetical protein